MNEDDKYPQPRYHCEGMLELWQAGKIEWPPAARKHVQEFDVSKGDEHLAEFKAELLAWMDRQGYPA